MRIEEAEAFARSTDPGLVVTPDAVGSRPQVPKPSGQASLTLVGNDFRRLGCSAEQRVAVTVTSKFNMRRDLAGKPILSKMHNVTQMVEDFDLLPFEVEVLDGGTVPSLNLTIKVVAL
jgi:hypothetical protein